MDRSKRLVSTAGILFFASIFELVDPNAVSAQNHQLDATLNNWTIPWFPYEPGHVDNNPFSDIEVLTTTKTSQKIPWFPNEPGFVDANPQVDLPAGSTKSDTKAANMLGNWSMPWLPSKPGTLDPNPNSKLSTPLNGPRIVPWFPNAPNDVDRNPNAIQFGVEECDDGLANIQQDFNPENVTQRSAYLCQDDRELYRPNYSTHPLIFNQEMPPNYVGAKVCINESIVYDQQAIPTYGSHRPIGSQYGEYVFVPPQRWLNSMAAGAVVMLYHPCADSVQVELLRRLITHCLTRHIITASNLPSTERPLVLVTWGNRLEMSAVAQPVVVDFIKTNALHGSRLRSPSPKTNDNKTRLYDHMLINVANVVSDEFDSELCPNLV